MRVLSKVVKSTLLALLGVGFIWVAVAIIQLGFNWYNGIFAVSLGLAGIAFFIAAWQAAAGKSVTSIIDSILRGLIA